MAIVNITDLQREAKSYNPLLQMLPFTVLAEPLAALGINLIDVKDKNIVVSFERKGGSTRPYTVGNPDDEPLASEIGRMKERELVVKACVLAFRDHAKNYDGKIVVNGQAPANNTDKRHPIERLILEQVIRTVAEDIVDAMFFAKRDPMDLTPMGMFDGFNEIVDTEISAGEISVSKGNMKTTGAIASPVDDADTDAIDRTIGFIRCVHPQLRKLGRLLMPFDCRNAVMDALENKTKYKSVMTFDQVVAYLRDKCNAPNLNIVSHSCLGTGSRLIYTVPGNFDLGMKTAGEQEFVQVRAPYKDPNWWQFWNQFEIGGRIIGTHEKVFATNEQTNTALELSGDYRS